MIRRATVDDAAAIARVHIESWRAAYRGIVPQAHLDGMSLADRTERWEVQLAGDPAVATFVADEGAAGVVGFANGGPCRSDGLDSDGELYAIYLLPARWRSGLGRLLMRAVVDELRARGMASLSVWVLRDNIACRFYEALGGVRAGEREHFVGGACLPKVAYAWAALPTL
jgi:ribosomal protein S18 acetylase RimI-like enzyme